MPLLPCAAYAADETFSQQLSQMVNAQDDSNYFGTMQLTIGSNTVTLDGVESTLDVSPEIRNQRTMLPIRYIAETVGAEVSWDANSRTVIISGMYGEDIHCTVGQPYLNVDGDLCEIDSPSYINNGRTCWYIR